MGYGKIYHGGVDVDLVSILSALGGGILRLAPDVMKILDAKNERAHALEMAKLDMQAKTAEASMAHVLATENNASAEEQARLSALAEAIKAQGVPSGVRWVDALSASVRPVLVYCGCILIGLEAVGLVATVNPETRSIVSAMVGFFFVHRTMRQK